MIQSMTGFASTENAQKDFTIKIEARSVNSRFLDTRVNLPKEYSEYDLPIKSLIKDKFKRGKVDLSVHVETTTKDESLFTIDFNVLNHLKDKLPQIEENLERKIEFSISELFKIDLLTKDKKEETKIDLWPALEETIDEVLTSLKEMRNKEGQKLADVLVDTLSLMNTKLNAVDDLKDKVIDIFKERIKKNMALLEVELPSEDNRIQKEIAFLLDKADINEEIDRLRIHLGAFQETLESSKIAGKKLDFLTQEMNREVNTICSKSGLTEITSLGIELKSAIEQIREQVQNIE